MGTGGVVAVAVVAAALGVAAGARLFGGRVEESPGPDAASVEARLRSERESLQRAHESAMKAARAERDDAEKRAERMEADLAAARKEAEEAKAAASAATAAASSAAAPGGGTGRGKEAGPHFSFAEYDQVLATVDWKSVGENTRAMVPLIEKLREGASKKEQPDLGEIGRIQKHNASLIEAAGKIMGKIPGSGVNGSFTHPAFMVNSMAATLDAAGLPLSAAQSEALGRIGRDFSDRDRARIQAYEERAFELQKVLDEADLKERFFDAAFALLNPEQRATLTPPAVKGILSFDLYSSGLMLAQHLAPTPVANRDAYSAQAARTLAARAGVPEEKKEELGRMVAEWASALPEAWFEGESETFFGQPVTRVAHVLDVGRRELSLLQRAGQELGLAEENAQKLRAIGFVLLPLLRKGE